MVKQFWVAVMVMTVWVGSATAGEPSRWYFKAVGGWNTTGDGPLQRVNGDREEQAEAGFDPAFAGGGSVGFQFSPKFRSELELMYRTSNLDSVAFPTSGSFNEGDYSSLALSLNGYIDFNAFNSKKWRPYLGAGLVLVEEVDVDFEVDDVASSFSTDDFGVQAMLGVRYQATERLCFDLEIRRLQAGSITMRGEENATGTVTADYNPTSFLVGVAYRF